MNSKPPSSAVRATVARSAPRRPGPSGVVKSGICRPIFTWHTSRSGDRCLAFHGVWRELGQGLKRAEERLAVPGRQPGEDLLLAAADRGLHGLADLAARGGQREQVDAPVGSVRLPLDQPALLELIEVGDDPALVRADGL